MTQPASWAADPEKWYRSKLRHRTDEQQAFGLKMFRSGLDTRLVNTFLNEGYQSWDEICARTPAELLRLPNLGRKTFALLTDVLHGMGRCLPHCWEHRHPVPDLVDDKDVEPRTFDVLEQMSPLARDVVKLAFNAMDDRDRYQREVEYWRKRALAAEARE